MDDLLQILSGMVVGDALPGPDFRDQALGELARRVLALEARVEEMEAGVDTQGRQG